MAFNLFEYIFIYRKNFRQHASCDFNEEGYKIMVELTLKDIEFFKTEGYLVKRNVLDPELMERARARLWEGAPEGRRRDDPETWTGPFTSEEENLSLIHI